MLFQSTLPRRERLERKLHNKQTDIISIHAPAKGATSRPTSISSTAAFQSTLPRRERRITSSFSSHRARFQSTLPRRERPLARPRLAVRTVISIHAPAKGATVQPHRGGHGIPISIHAPAKGATMIGGESDSGTGISIHAPAKGATCGPRKWSAMRWYFNPRSREGSDGRLPDLHPTDKLFQSTLPRRERHGFLLLRYAASGNFNPRSREGSDR